MIAACLTTVIIFASMLLKLLFVSLERTQGEVILVNGSFLALLKNSFDGSSRSASELVTMLCCEAYTNKKCSDVWQHFALLRIHNQLWRVCHNMSFQSGVDFITTAGMFSSLKTTQMGLAHFFLLRVKFPRSIQIGMARVHLSGCVSLGFIHILI